MSYIPEVRTFAHKSATVNIVLWEGKHATVSSLYSKERGQGHASYLMGMICRFADEQGMKLIIEIGSYGDDPGGMDNIQLEKFYEKYGFVRISKTKPVVMERSPQRQM